MLYLSNNSFCKHLQFLLNETNLLRDKANTIDIKCQQHGRFF